jgi:hypothetical protein
MKQAVGASKYFDFSTSCVDERTAMALAHILLLEGHVAQGDDTLDASREDDA